MRTTPHLMLEPAFHPGLDTAGSGRDAIGLGAATSGRLDARHGTILSLEDINVSFDGFKALRDLTLYIGIGELRCIIGPNGAGKTTLMDVITGKTRPQSGTAYFGDTLDLTRMSEVQIAQAGIGRKFQKPTVFEALSVFENLELAQRADKSVWASLRARLDGTQRERAAPGPRAGRRLAGGGTGRRTGDRGLPRSLTPAIRSAGSACQVAPVA